jgi:hypothetical protein
MHSPAPPQEPASASHHRDASTLSKALKAHYRHGGWVFLAGLLHVHHCLLRAGGTGLGYPCSHSLGGSDAAQARPCGPRLEQVGHIMPHHPDHGLT